MKEQLKCSNCGAEINNVLKETNTKAGVNPSGDPNLLIKAHIAEYQALANRINGFMALQFVPWPPLVVFLTLVATVYKYELFDPTIVALVAWGAVVVVQVAVLVYNFALFEVYNHVRYIETKLKPKVATLLGTDSFCGYEKYLKETGKVNNPLIGDCGLLVFQLAAIILATYCRWTNWSKLDSFGLAVNGFVLFFTAYTAIRIVKARKGFAGVMNT